MSLTLSGLNDTVVNNYLDLQAQITALSASVGDKLASSDANALYLMLCGVIVFFMQAGFALLEAGSVRAKNTKNILMKNLLDACIGALIWFAWGYGIAYDGGGMCGPHKNSFIGHPPGSESDSLGSFFIGGYNWNDDGTPADGYAYAGWWFQYVFCAAAATIVSGAMAERTTLIGYLFYTMSICGFIYPVVVYWTWGGGWISMTPAGKCDDGRDKGFNGGLLDFAGSGIVHMTGGIAALVGAAVVGPRTGRFDEEKKPIALPAHSTTFQVLGTFILWLGWYGFNPGSTLVIAGSGLTMARCVATTTLSAATGGLTVVLTDKLFISHTWDVGMLCNGILAGLVSITAGCAALKPILAVVAGLVGGLVYLLSSKTVLNVCKVDDPLDAFSVHGACGCWGVIAAALMASDEFGTAGAFYGDGALLTTAITFIIVDVAWVGGLSLCMFVPLKLIGWLRVSPEMEEAGMDVSKHGGPAYVQDTVSSSAGTSSCR